jgi:mitochondrial enoyl-[acyl-carrier protein] reductase / trans-2-enoyl-CoA reductase
VNVVRRDSAAAAVKAAGGDVVLVDGPDLDRRVADATGQAKIRLGIDAIGGQATNRLAACLAEGGTLVNYGLMSGEDCVVSPRAFVFRDVTLRGFWLALWFRKATAQQQMALFGEIGRLVATGRLKARIQDTYDLPQIKQAVAAAAAGEREGKILVVPKG